MHIKSEFIRKSKLHYTIRDMTLEDVKEICELDKLADVTPWSERSFVDCIETGYYCRTVESKDGAGIIGFGVMSFGADEAHVLNVAVLPSCHRKGIGRALMLDLIDYAKDNSSILYLEVRKSNQPAIALYKHLKFIEVNERKDYYLNHDGTREDAIIMILPFGELL